MNPSVPVFVVVLLSFSIAVILVLRRLRATQLKCAKCGAELEESGRCSECGWVIAKPIGEVGRVTAIIRSREPGEVKVRGRRWTAQQASPMPPLNVGTKVRVVASRGMTLIVGPVGGGPTGRARLG